MRFLTIILLLIASVSFGQNDTAYYNYYGGTNNDEFESVIQNNDGGFSILGTTSSFGNGETDFLVINLDSNLNEVNSFTIGTDKIEKISEFKKINDNFYFAGITNSWGNGEFDLYLVKTNSTGDIIWEKTIGSVSWEEFIDFDIVENSLFVLGNIIDTDVNSTYLLKLDTNGTITNKIKLDSTNNHTYSKILTSESKNIILSGYFEDGSSTNFFLSKFNASDQSNIFFNEFSFNMSQKVVEGNIFGDKIFLVGESNFVSQSSNFDYYLTQLDTNGIFYWSSHFGSSTVGNDIGNDVEYFNDTIYTLGSTSSYGAGLNDYYFMICNNSGNYINGTTYGFQKEDIGKKVIKTKNWIYLFGDSQDYGINYTDILIVKTKNIYTNPPKKIILNNLVNPKVITIVNSVNSNAILKFDYFDIYNTLGQKITTLEFVPGIYFIKYYADGKLVSIKKEFLNTPIKSPQP